MDRRLEKIRWMILDVDGTMTDGGVYLDSSGGEMKKFSIKDGAGILLARQAGIEAVILTGRESRCVSRRAEELGISHVYQNIREKKRFLAKLMEQHSIQTEELMYIGDDLNDLPAMKLAGITVCPKDGAALIKENCTYVTEAAGGEGVVREMTERILKQRGILKRCMQQLWGEENGEAEG